MTNEHAGVRKEEYTHEELREMISSWLSPSRVPKRFRIITDTSNFLGVDFDDVVILDGRPYLIRHCEREGRFTIDEQPKFWVKRAIDLTDGSKKVIKMVFHEKFTAEVAGLTFECVRSPKKEARILDTVRGHQKFMQGFSVKDTAGNIIRIIDYIPGSTIADRILKQAKGHEEYYFDHFPDIFNEFIELVEAIKFLHENGEKHGDIRRDHIIYGRSDGIYRWIDFDFNYWHQENMFSYDIFGLGNVLIYLTGQGDVTDWQLNEDAPDILEKLCKNDMNIVFRHRVANLQKLYPYITDQLAFVLEHFSIGADTIYDDTGEFLDDLYEARENLTEQFIPPADLHFRDKSMTRGLWGDSMETGSSKQACQIKDRHLLVALDRSENAKRAALYVADFLGGVPGFRVTLLSIVPEPSEDYFETGEERKAWIEEHSSGVEKMLRNYREVLIQSGFSEDKVVVRVEVRNCPSIADCILDDQKKLGCCTIVLGRRGISKKEEFIYGSTSNKVLHSGKNCAVWVIE